MIQSTSTGRASGVSLGGVGSISGGPAQQAAAAMTTITSRVAGTITRELGLVPRDGAKPAAHPGARAGDPYGVKDLADQLAASLGGGPADAGRLARALDSFTGDVAALLAAQPRASVIGTVAGLHFDLTDADGRMGPTQTDQAVFAIEAGSFRLREDAVW